MSRSYVPNKYVSSTEEQLLQQLYDVKKVRSCDQMVKCDMEQEIESLQKEIKLLRESNIASLRASQSEYTRQIRSLKTELDEQRENFEIAEIKYKEEVSNQQKQIVPVIEPFDYAQFKEEMRELMREKEYLADELKTYKPMLEQKNMFLSDLNNRFDLLTEQYNELKSHFDSNKLELSETRLALQESRDENAILSSELATLKAGPVGDIHRGNSLFAEVEDNRQTLVQKLTILKNKYSKAKRAAHEKSFEMQKLKHEIAQTQMMKQEENLFLKEKEEDYIHTLRKTNSELNIIISRLKQRPESPEIVTISESDLSNLNWIHAVIDDARKGEREAMNNFLDANLRVTEEASKLYAANIKIKQLNDELGKLRGKIKELELKLSTPQENELDDPNTFKEQDIITTKERVKSNKSIRFAEDVKGGDDSDVQLNRTKTSNCDE